MGRKRNELSTMQEIETKQVFFAGISGCSYPFITYPLDADLPDIGAVYIFIGTPTIPGQYEPLYIGETDAFTPPILTYEKWLCVVRKMGDCVCIYVEDDAAARLQVKQDLIDLYHPPCNITSEST